MMNVSDVILFVNLIVTVKCLDTSSLYYGKHMKVSFYEMLDDIGLHGCARACGSTLDCKSFSFHIPTLRCFTFYVNAALNPTAFVSISGYIYGEGDSAYQDTSLMGPCANHACSEHSACVVLQSLQTVCIPTACSYPPQIAGTNPMVNSTIPVGGIYTYTCDQTLFTMVGGPATLTCQGNGQWSSPAFQCDFIDCGTPNPISNAAVSGGGTVLGEKRMYSCNSGYTSSGFPEIMCQQSGTWSATSFICYAVDD